MYLCIPAFMAARGYTASCVPFCIYLVYMHTRILVYMLVGLCTCLFICFCIYLCIYSFMSSRGYTASCVPSEPKTLQHTAPHCNTLQHTATLCNTATDCITLQHSCKLRYPLVPSTLQHIATHCNTLKHTATHWNTPQRTATHRNILQHTATQRRAALPSWALARPPPPHQHHDGRFWREFSWAWTHGACSRPQSWHFMGVVCFSRLQCVL